MKDPASRPSAVQLLEHHPFITRAPGSDVIKSLVGECMPEIDKYREIEARMANKIAMGDQREYSDSENSLSRSGSISRSWHENVMRSVSSISDLRNAVGAGRVSQGAGSSLGGFGRAMRWERELSRSDFGRDRIIREREWAQELSQRRTQRSRSPSFSGSANGYPASVHWQQYGGMGRNSFGEPSGSTPTGRHRDLAASGSCAHSAGRLRTASSNGPNVAAPIFDGDLPAGYDGGLGSLPPPDFKTSSNPDGSSRGRHSLYRHVSDPQGSVHSETQPSFYADDDEDGVSFEEHEYDDSHETITFDPLQSAAQAVPLSRPTSAKSDDGGGTETPRASDDTLPAAALPPTPIMQPKGGSGITAPSHTSADASLDPLDKAATMLNNIPASAAYDTAGRQVVHLTPANSPRATSPDTAAAIGQEAAAHVPPVVVTIEEENPNNPHRCTTSPCEVALPPGATHTRTARAHAPAPVDPAAGAADPSTPASSSPISAIPIEGAAGDSSDEYAREERNEGGTRAIGGGAAPSTAAKSLKWSSQRGSA